MTDRPEWFAPKRYGYGSGLPISWQGWLVLLGFLADCGATAYFFDRRPIQTFAIMVPAVATLLVITAHTTRGGWRWRWGDED